ncbi:arginine transporter [Celeribacter sp.]|uniref:arginine transporter n=1 Tax=Celeribacter sp. TaxID=1890673 RepID=UPI003A8D1C7F
MGITTSTTVTKTFKGIVLVSCLALVASCGQRGTVSRGASTLSFAAGPIYSACIATKRKAATPSTCGCVQAVAHQKLSASEQSKAVAFFKDPHKAQEVRQSDNPFNETFWKRYKAFGASAASTCG